MRVEVVDYLLTSLKSLGQVLDLDQITLGVMLDDLDVVL